MLNLPLFDKVLDIIESDPDSWNQLYWARKTDCGTAYCFAGHVTNLTMPEDWEFIWDGRTILANSGGEVTISIRAANIRAVGDIKFRNIDYFAREQLGITSEEAELLFSPLNTLSKIKSIRQELIEKYDLG